MPNSGPSSGGTSVTINGTGFSSVKGPDEFGSFVTAVHFGSTAATSFSATERGGGVELTAVAPPGTGTVDVTVETYGGTSPISPADLFSYL
jgi:hypothetical protein